MLVLWNLNSSGPHALSQAFEDSGARQILQDAFLISLKFKKVGRCFVPADEAALSDVEGHTLDPFADSLELVVIAIDTAAFRLNQPDGD